MEPKKVEFDGAKPCFLGIDEAGRGPCLGPMVYSSAYCAIEDANKLVALGANDSKQLTEDQRDVLRSKIDGAPFLATDSIVLHAQELSAKMLRPSKYNLNAISHDTALELVRRAIDHGVNVREVYVDTVGTAAAYAEKFRDAFPQLDKVVVAKKADSTFPIVGAASIVAKTTRDKEVREWKFPEEAVERPGVDGPKFSRDYGSGYPSDPKTKAWLRDHVDGIFGFPSFARFSWATTRVILEREAVSVSWACDDEDYVEAGGAECVNGNDGSAEVGKQQRSIHTFFMPKPAAPSAKDGRVTKPQSSQRRNAARYVTKLGLKACQGF